MKYLPSLTFTFFLLGIISCNNRKVDKLMPETVEFLKKQEQARCNCLDQYGDQFMTKMEEGITFMKDLPSQYDLDSLAPQDKAVIKAGLSGFEAYVQIIMPCIHAETQKNYQSDQLTQMLIAEDFRVVLELDSAKTENEKQERMNVPSLEIMDELCPRHKKVVLKLQEFLEVAEVLPKELQ